MTHHHTDAEIRPFRDLLVGEVRKSFRPLR